MNKFELWMLRRTLARAYRSGGAKPVTIQVFATVYEQLVNEFTEDNRPTTYSFIRECLEAALPEWLKT